MSGNTMLAILAIRMDGGTQSRAELRTDWVEEYATDMNAGASFPPVVVFFDGEEYWLADGFHRTHAANYLGMSEIAADVRQGTQRDATLYALGANSNHGHRRTNEDKRRAVMWCLKDAEFAEASHIKIANLCGVSDRMVGEMRKDLSPNRSEIETRTVTRNGVTYQQNTANIGRKAESPASLPEPERDDEDAGGIPGGFSCDDCDEFFNEAVWHCKSCDHHWPMYRDQCWNCHAPDPNAEKPKAPWRTDNQEEREEPQDAPAHNHRAQGTGENEWYTPEGYIQAAREVMGDIDLDPASSEIANQTVQAARIHTIQDDGLAVEWGGRVWLNPPYAQPFIMHFMGKLVEEVTSGNVESAIALTHNYTDTAWFHTAASAASAICFTRGRIGFLSPTGQKAAPTQGQAFFYYGPNVKGFTAAFGRFGLVMVRHA